MPYMILIAILILLDQALKHWVMATIPLYQHVDFIPSLVSLTYVQNTGAAFSMFSQHTWALTLVSALMSLGLAIALMKNFFSRPFGKFALSLVLAGAIGNLIDRATLGFVVDMFHLLFMKFAVFNIADICVVVGGIFSGYYYIFLYDKYDNPLTKDGKEENTPTETSNSPEENPPESTSHTVETPPSE